MNHRIDQALSHYISDYAESRARFRRSAAQAGFELKRYATPHMPPGAGDEREPSSVDVALRGPARADFCLVISSGLHGVEGPFGAAAQSALLSDARVLEAHEDTRLVLIHALNPFGLPPDRRWHQLGVDLNHTFLHPAEHYAGAPLGFEELMAFLSPKTPPRRRSLFQARAAALIARRGLSHLRRAITTGQYDHPQGLFYGGAQPSWLFHVLKAAYRGWLAGAQETLPLDMHTGLGPWGGVHLHCSGAEPEVELHALRRRVGQNTPSFEATGAGGTQPIRGSFFR